MLLSLKRKLCSGPKLPGTPIVYELPSVNVDNMREDREKKNDALQIDKDRYSEKCRMYNDLLLSTKRRYFQGKIEDADQRQLFQVVERLTSHTDF